MTNEYKNNLEDYLKGEGVMIFMSTENLVMFADKRGNSHVVSNYNEAREALGYAS